MTVSSQLLRNSLTYVVKIQKKIGKVLNLTESIWYQLFFDTTRNILADWRLIY
jgi:hypothetical protein